ncbi:hypothetical protein WCD74_15950 [Actinomycetospora sp. OC33-EN08]|uniref:Uncharacterized protein n=1 Tax=Actinomycetospora aurantiaca TaxID=3129233 RepID=A0ABU8MPM4_9PSEU
MTDDDRVLDLVIRRHGAVIDVRENPEAILDIIRRFAGIIDDGGAPPGGTTPTGPTPPTSARFEGNPGEPGPSTRPFEAAGPTLADVMREVLQLRRAVDELQARLADRPDV